MNAALALAAAMGIFVAACGSTSMPPPPPSCDDVCNKLASLCMVQVPPTCFASCEEKMPASVRTCILGATGCAAAEQCQGDAG